MTVEANVTLFKNSHGNVQIALASGVLVAFLLDPATGQGRFFTSNKKLERDLQTAVDNDNEFGVYIDPAEPIIDLNAATPLEQLKAKIRKELMAELQSGGQLIDAGISRPSQEQLNQAISSTTSIPGAHLTEEQAQLQQSQVVNPAPILVDGTGQIIKDPVDQQESREQPTTVTETAETIQPTGANSSALDALNKLKAGKTS